MPMSIVLERFMIFNASEGKDESKEGDKLLYHWSRGASDNNYKISSTEQIDDICLCDATISASFRLNCDNVKHQENNDAEARTGARDSRKCLQMNFGRTIIIVIEVEPEATIWFAVRVGTVQTQQQRQTSQPEQESSCESDQVGAFSSLTNDIPAEAIERVVKNVYSRFCLLNGTFQMISRDIEQKEREAKGENCTNDSLKSSIRNRLRYVCDQYFDSILPGIHLTSSVSNIVSLYNYVFYLDLNPVTLMTVNSFVNHLVCTNAYQLRHTIAIFNDQLLWSSMNMTDTRLLYNYLVSTLIRDALQEELSTEVNKVRIIAQEKPIYLSATSDVGEDTRCDKATHEEEEGSESSPDLVRFYLTLFRSSNNMTLGLILRDNKQSELIRSCELLLTSDSRLGVIPLASLAQTVGQNFLRSNTPSVSSSYSGTSLGGPNFASVNFSTSASTSSSDVRKRQLSQANNAVTLKNFIQTSEQKYLCINRINVSVCWPKGMDLHGKEHQPVLDNSGNFEIPGSSRNRLIKLLIELEPEFNVIERRTSCRVEEFIGKSTNDCWILVTSSKYKSIYSVHKSRNASLSDAMQCAINLKSVLACNRP